MKITGRNNQQIAPVNPFAGAPAPDATEQTGQADGVSDSVELASTTQIRKFAQAAEALPAVRVERVEGLREQIDDGSYHVESDKLARKVVDDAIQEIVARETGHDTL